MPIIRTKHNKQNPFVMINKKGLEDPNLSWQAKGLWAFLLSKFDEWTINVTHLSKIYEKKGGGEKAIYAMLNELIEHGYCEREKIRDDKGLFVETYYNILEFKNKVPHSPERNAVEPDADKRPLNKKDSLPKKENSDISCGANAPPVASAIAERLKILLLSKLDSINTKRKALSDKQLIDWNREIDLMMRIDKRTEQDIEALIKWFATDKFWSKTIQSADSLRRNFDKMYTQMCPPVVQEDVNREFTVKLIKEYPDDLKHLKIFKSYVLDPLTHREIYFANHSHERFKELFLEMTGGEES